MTQCDESVALNDVEYHLGGLGGSLGFLTRVVNIQINDYVRTKSDMLASPATLTFLTLVRENPGIRQNQAGRILLVHQPNIAALVKKLTEAGLLASPSKETKRSGLWITNKGVDLVAKSLSAVDLARECAESLSDKEYRQLVGLLCRVYRSRL